MRTMENVEVPGTPSRQPVPAEPLLWLRPESEALGSPGAGPGRVTYVGRVRVPIAGPYRPWARLYRLPDRRLVWAVRLWEVDRVVRRLTSTALLVHFARVNRLPALEAQVRALDRQARDAP